MIHDCGYCQHENKDLEVTVSVVDGNTGAIVYQGVVPLSGMTGGGLTFTPPIPIIRPNGQEFRGLQVYER